MKHELPDGWGYIQLGDLAKIKTGKLDVNAQDKDGKYPFFTCSQKIYKIDFYDYDCECVLVAGNGDLNVKYYCGKFNAYQRTYIIESFDKDILDVKYLYHFLSKYIEILRNKTIGGVIKYIKLGYLTEIKLPVPPLETQHKIVAILEKAEETKKLRAQADELTQQLLQNVFLEMFGDPINNHHDFKIGKIGDLLTKTQYGTSQKANEEEKGIPILRMNNITYEGNWNFTSLKHIEFELKDKDKYLINKGELLFNRTNSKELVGKSAVYRENKTMAFAGYLIKLITDSLATSEYVAAHLNSKYGKMYLSNMAKNIVGMANINAKEVQRIPILIPPMELRTEYAEIISQIGSTKKLQKQSSHEIDTLFNALMQKAFTGDLIY